MNSDLTNYHVIIIPNTLFENGCDGVIIAMEHSSIAVKLSESVRLPNGRECLHLVAQIRHEDRSFQDALDGDLLLCGLTLVPNDLFDPEHPCDVGWWRGGGGAVIGDIQIADLSRR